MLYRGRISFDEKERKQRSDAGTSLHRYDKEFIAMKHRKERAGDRKHHREYMREYMRRYRARRS
jgi:hypothetical protein